MFEIFDGRKDFFQWDLNQKIIISEKVDRVHFVISGKIEATEVKTEDEQFVADVPNIMLQSSGCLNVYAYVMGEDDEESYTKIEEYFVIKGRPKPPDYVYTETEVLNYETVRKEIEDIEKRLKDVEENGGGTGASGGYYIPNVSEEGVLSWDASNEDMPKVPAANVKGPEGKQGPKGEQGIQGVQGNPGKDGGFYVPSVSEDGKLFWFRSNADLPAPISANIMGPQGPQGIQGPQGEPGKGLIILGYYSTLLQLETSVFNPSVGDIYGVGFSAPYNLYSWDGTKWVDNGKLQGAKGDPGDDYVLTEEDKKEIAEMIPSGGVSFETDETLFLENGVLGVNTATDVEGDNTLPITSAAVYETVGNIEILLKTI